MMQHSGITKGFWAEAMGTAAHVLNRSPHKSLAWRTPFELLFGRVPEISYVRVFRCRAWVFNNDKGKKWDPKSKPMILVSYETGSKAYRLWNPAMRSIVVSANVRFDENVFPNKPTTTPLTVPTMPVASTSKLPLPTLRDYTYIRLSDDDEEPPSKPVLPPQPIVHLPTPSPSAPVTITAPPPPVSTPQPSRPTTPDPGSASASRSTSPGPGLSTRSSKHKVKPR